MKYYAPIYYNKFKCIADKCNDCCCIGWEIDIDSDTLKKYSTATGSIGEKLRDNIIVSEDGSDCFKLTNTERCPFLNENNLCELILTAGEDMLCEICHIHPRFVNVLPDHYEIGLGLCCEEAARIILSDKEVHKLIEIDNDNEIEYPTDDWTSYLENVRCYIFSCLEESATISKKCTFLLNIGNAIENTPLSYRITTNNLNNFKPDAENDIKLIQSLEPLNAQWSEICCKLSSAASDEFTFDEKNNLAYENLLKYYIYRYFINAADDNRVSEKTSLAVFSACAVTYIMKAADMSFEESACLWSKQSEYSEENMNIIYDYLELH